MCNFDNMCENDKALSAIERRKEAYTRYQAKLLIKQHNVDSIEEVMQIKEAERIRKYHEGYQKHLEIMREQRRERGLKPKGRPSKHVENETHVLNMINELDQINNIETEMNCKMVESLDIPSYMCA